MEKKNFILRAFGSYIAFAIYTLGMALAIVALIYSILGGSLSTVGQGEKSIALFTFIIVLYVLVSSIGIFCRLALKLKFPMYLDLYIIVLAFFAIIGGNGFHLYSRVPGADKIMHFIAGPAFVMFGYSVALMLYPKERRKHHPVFLFALFAFCFSLAVGYVWEMMEFGLDTFLGTNTQRWADQPSTSYFRGSGLIDTMMDMFVHLIGAIPAAIFTGLWFKKYPDSQSLLVIKQKDVISKKQPSSIFENTLSSNIDKPTNKTPRDIFQDE